MKTPPVACLVAFSCLLAPAQTSTTDVGTGSPSDAIARSFVAAYFRNTFYTQLSMPPLGDVRKFGTSGLVQEFADAAKTTGVKLALIKPNTAVQAGDGSDVFQLTGLIYSYYSSVGVTTAGQPTTDTLLCPDSSCQYQIYDKSYVLFAYLQAGANGQNFTLRDPFYTKWNALGGISSLGPPNSAEQSVTSAVSSAAATAQTYKKGALYNITSGLLSGRHVSVGQPVYDLYVSIGTHTGFLGYPTGEPVTLTGGGHRQTFEGGSIDYSDTSAPALRLPVNSVAISAGGTSVRLNLNDTMNVRASTFGANGNEFTDRSVTFVTTNSRVISIQQTGAAAVLRATGGGSANVTAVSEGKTSPAITFFVTAPCCQIGEGSPTAAVQQLFQDAVTRSRIVVRLPAASPVHRVGGGLVQELQGVDPNSPARYLVTVADRSTTAYVVSGDILSKYGEQGGTSQAVAYPTGDAVYDAQHVARQLFEGGAIAGSPARVVSGAFLQKWASLGYEAGQAGQPTGDVNGFLTFTGTSGRVQPFQNGALYGASSGTQAGKVYLVRGLIATAYNTLGAGRGQLGLPSSDEFTTGGKRHQDFEGGYLEYAQGDAEAKLTLRDRKPSITAIPSIVAAGNRVRVTVAGFADASSLRVSITGQSDFVIKTQTGSYFWDVYVPTNAVGGAITIRALDTANAAATATSSYTVRAGADIRASILKVHGDSQSASPGSQAPQSLRVAVRDDTGNPLSGVEVRFSTTPGAQVSPASAITDAQGQAETFLRMPLSEGIVLANAESVRQVATFSARSVQSMLTNYVKLTQSGDVPLGNGTATVAQKGSLLTAAASMVRYYQNRGDLTMPNGVADPGLLNQFLKSLCKLDAQGVQICDGFVSPKDSQEQFVNLWRLTDFVAGAVDVSIERPDLPVIRDLLAQNSPVLLALSMTANGAPAGAHFVVAIGVAADGTILIHDPNPAFGRNSLADYSNGFTASGAAWKGVITGAARLLPRAPSASGFIIVSSAATTDKLSVTSQAGDCGASVEWPNTATVASSPATPTGTFRQTYCDGTQAAYQIDLSGSGAFSASLTDLGSFGSKFNLAGGGQSTFRASRPGTHLVVGPQDTNFSSNSIVNAATFTADIAPGGLIAIFGDGLAKTGSTTKIEIGDKIALVTAAFPFQVNAQIPLGIQPGTQALRVTSPFGVSEQTVQIQALAPAIFRLDPVPLGLDKGAVNKGATINQDGRLNLPSNPARRGSVVTVFGTGFGEVKPGPAPVSTVIQITVALGGQDVPVNFAGLTPGFFGLYQVNVTIPATAPPGLDLPMSFRIGGVQSSAVEIAVQ